MFLSVCGLSKEKIVVTPLMQDSIPGTLCMHKSRSNRLEELFFIRIHDTTLYTMILILFHFFHSCLLSIALFSHK